MVYAPRVTVVRGDMHTARAEDGLDSIAGAAAGVKHSGSYLDLDLGQ